MKARLLNMKLLFASIAAVGVAVACIHYSSALTSSAWSSGTFLFGEEEPHSSIPLCETRSVPVVGVSGIPETANLCVYERPNWRYANYTKRVDLGYITRYEYYFVVGFGNESSMYVVGNMSGQRRPVEVPGSDDLMFNTLTMGFSNNHNLTVIKDFPLQLELGNDGPGLSKRYTLKEGAERPMVPNSSGNAITTGAVGVSPNGKWIAVEDMATGFLLIDPESYQIKWFSNYKHRYGVGSDAHINFVISNDGQFVATFDFNITPKIYTVDNDCAVAAEQYTDSFVAQVQSAESCLDDGGRMYSALETRFSASEIRSMSADRFSDDSGVLYFQRYDYGDDPEGMEMKVFDVPLLANGYTLSPVRLDYLALGDSYSSGEGDTEKDKRTGKKHYRPGTDVEEDIDQNQPREKCHISTRSYPYILSQGMGLGDPTNDSSTKWQSVACSGAVIFDINDKDSDSYKGQGKGGNEGSRPRLEGYDFAAKKATALNEFIPGRQKQIEFVRKYRPKVITLTIGGNDVGFGDRIKSCVWFGVCGEAQNLGKAALGKEIIDQYDQLKALYRDLYSASGGQAKIYVLGYPKFINGDVQAPCSLNVGRLNDIERTMIEASVEYLNNVIEQAANAVGVKYIDLEDSLEGGRLCDEGQLYMTGLAAMGSSENQESFHPNARGNYQMAMKLWEEVGNESLLDYDICSEGSDNLCGDNSATKETIAIPPYFQVTEPGYEIKYTSDMTSGNAAKGEPISVTRAKYSLAPGSAVEFTMFSDPVGLGSFLVDDDGSLDADLQIPSSVPAGYHTLVADGITYSGEPIRYEQIILVRGSDPSDIDENGVLDSNQQCGPFIESSGVDADLDGIDDACDPEISEEPELYRWRLGYSGRIYNGSPEDESQVYIERNIWASSRTGVSDDYDPDEDGWAVVGVSQKSQVDVASLENIDAAVEFEILGDGSQGDPYSPVIYIHPNTQSCKAYRPTSLSQVLINEPRTLSVAEISNEKCPQELPDDDPQEPESDPPKDEGLLSRLRGRILAIKSRLHSLIDIITAQLRNLMAPSHRW